MSPKEKAKELVDKYDETLIYLPRFVAKQCALIAVNEILHTCVEARIYYWMDVRIEIEQL